MTAGACCDGNGGGLASGTCSGGDWCCCGVDGCSAAVAWTACGGNPCGGNGAGGRGGGGGGACGDGACETAFLFLSKACFKTLSGT